MKPLPLIAFFILLSCSWKANKQPTDKSKMFTESEILHQLDLAFEGTPNEYFPAEAGHRTLSTTSFRTSNTGIV